MERLLSLYILLCLSLSAKATTHLPSLWQSLQLVALPSEVQGNQAIVKHISDPEGIEPEEFWIYLPIQINLSSFGTWWEPKYTFVYPMSSNREISIVALGKLNPSHQTPIIQSHLVLKVAHAGQYRWRIIQPNGRPRLYQAEVLATGATLKPLEQ